MIDNITREIYDHVLGTSEFNIFFQPIVSFDKKQKIGCEALLRASCNGDMISTENLFNFARKSHTELDLDFMCRNESLYEFSEMNEDCMLFINFEAALLNDYIENADNILKMLDDVRIGKEKIVIEINEKHIADSTVLLDFVKFFKEKGFLIALDDVGEGHSNLNRIVLTQPDIVKIDRMSIMNIHNDYYKCETVRAITNLASKIGAIVVAEGVEDVNEIMTCLSLGINLFQGYFFSRAVPKNEFIQLNMFNKCENLSNTFQIIQSEQVIQRDKCSYERREVLLKMVNKLIPRSLDEFTPIIENYISEYPDLECIYVIDETGNQVTETIFNENTDFKSVYLFSPGKKNDSHLIKPYYYLAIQRKYQIFISDRYISAATGNFCETYSFLFSTYSGQAFVLCFDFIE